MNVGESVDVQTVLGYFLGREDITKAQATASAVRLAERASRTLMAGPGSREIEEAMSSAEPAGRGLKRGGGR